MRVSDYLEVMPLETEARVRTMERVTIQDEGHLAIPEAFRKALGLAKGDRLIVELVDGELRLRPEVAVIRQIQEMVRRYNPEGRSMVDELIADRRREAENE